MNVKCVLYRGILPLMFFIKASDLKLHFSSAYFIHACPQTKQKTLFIIYYEIFVNMNSLAFNVNIRKST